MPVDPIRKLQTVNECLRTMGETELASVEEFHPFANDALALLDLRSGHSRRGHAHSTRSTRSGSPRSMGRSLSLMMQAPW